MNDIKLKPCPFCGGEKPDLYSVGTGFGDAWCVLCPTCGASTMGTRESRDEAVNSWNMRAAVGDPDFSRAIHDGSAWQKVRECHLPKTWVDHGIIEHYGTTAWRLCNECGAEVLASPANFCPNCGAKVVGA